MRDGREELLGRLTPAGWLLIVLNGVTFSALAPLLLVQCCPAVLLAGRRVSGLAFIATFMAGCLPGFFLGKWILEKCGVTVLRPPVPAVCLDEDGER